MSSIKRVLSIAKEKKQPQPERDPEALKRSISHPHSLAPKPVIDEWAKTTKKARVEAEERERDVTASQPAAQPPTSRDETPAKALEVDLKPHLKVVFVDASKPLPPTPLPSPIDGGDNFGNAVTAEGSNFITVAIARKSAASSWFCAGPDEEDPTDQAIMRGLGNGAENKLITEAIPGGPVWVFRNEEEKRQAIRVLATLRESMYRYSTNDTIPKCGRECEQCFQKILARRNASVTNEESVVTEDETVVGCSPQVTIFVTEVPEDEVTDEKAIPRLSLAVVDSSLADELDAQLKDWRASH